MVPQNVKNRIVQDGIFIKLEYLDHLYKGTRAVFNSSELYIFHVFTALFSNFCNPVFAFLSPVFYCNGAAF